MNICPRVIVEQELARNGILSAWVEKEFQTDAEKLAAWKMREKICELYPDFAPKLRGDIIWKHRSIS